jgi:hypothetical protein
MKRGNNIETTELFLVKTNWNRTFLGQIIRETDEDGLVILHGSVVVNEGMIWSAGSTPDELGDNLDDICTLKLKYNLHSSLGRHIIVAEKEIYLN